jgi:4-hydroxyacetophenone monooxygenase
MHIDTPNQTEAITETTPDIDLALGDAHFPSLHMALLQITRDESLFHEQYADTGLLRRTALDIITDLRDGKRTVNTELPDAEFVHTMMQHMAGGNVPEEYVPMMMQEMSLLEPEPWYEDIPAETRGKLKVAVIGAGMSGILTAIRLQEAGIPFVVFEKNSEVGGTWFENSYPGCRVDVPNHFYCYSFAPNYSWSSHFSKRDELLDYFIAIVDKYDLRPHIRFNTDVTSAEYVDDGCWQLTTQDGAAEQFNTIVSAVGQLNRPKLPDIAGLNDFAGTTIHSAQWRSDVDLTGKKVVVIGTGASAFQLVPEIAEQAEHVSVLQRSAPWLLPTPDYHDAVEPGHQWLLQHLPYYANWYRFWLFWSGCDSFLPTLTVDSAWQRTDSINAANEALRQRITEYISGQVHNDALLKKVIPDYPIGGKRPLRDNGMWLTALQRDNVDLITDAISKVTHDGVTFENGESIAADVIICATGFQADHFLWPMNIVGRDGIKLDDFWGSNPKAYLGITVPQFPNLFCLYGPNTNLVHGGSIIFHSECQVNYIMGCLTTLLTEDRRSLEPRSEVAEAFYNRVDEANQQRAWGIPQVKSWYKNSEGRVTQNWPFRLVDYWRDTKTPDAKDFIWR